MFDYGSFDDGRGRYPSRIAAHVPREVRREAEAAAVRQGITLGEFARRAIMSALDRHDGGHSFADRRPPEVFLGD
jgi:hypothetical protein